MGFSEWLVRDVTYPAYEWLRGRRTLRELADLRRLAGVTTEVVQLDAARRLRDLLAFAGTCVPYYAELLPRCGVDPHGPDPYAELPKLPVQEKADVRANAHRMVWRGVPGGALPHSSGGTTGDTLHFCIDRVRQAQGLGARLFMQSLFGARPGDRRLYLWGSPIETRGPRVKRWRDRLLNEMLLDAFEMSPAQMDRQLARIFRFKPRVLYGYPTATALLARHAATRLGPARFPWLRLVVLTGEEVTPDQVAQVRATFGCAVATEYGNREAGLIAHDCPHGRMHVVWPHILVEIAVAGQAVPPGQCGDVLCTTLNTRAQPFIRYRVGDVGCLMPEPCPCGMPFPVMRLVGGKITGFIALPNGRLCHGAITSHILRKERGIVGFRTHQHALDEFEVMLVVDEHFDRTTLERVRQRYRDLFGPSINVECRVVEGIPPDPSGKRRYVVSDVAPNYAEFEVVSTPRSQAPTLR